MILHRKYYLNWKIIASLPWQKAQDHQIDGFVAFSSTCRAIPRVTIEHTLSTVRWHHLVSQWYRMANLIFISSDELDHYCGEHKIKKSMVLLHLARFAVVYYAWPRNTFFFDCVFTPCSATMTLHGKSNSKIAAIKKSMVLLRLAWFALLYHAWPFSTLVWLYNDAILWHRNIS